MTIPAEIDTPEITIDRDVLQRNIDRMGAAVRAKGLYLRPHAKTHKMRIAGIFTFPGQSYAPGIPLEAADEEGSALAKAADLLAAAGFPITRRSGGYRPTAALTGTSTGTSGATEVRPGVYVFGGARQLELERCAPEDIALTIAATVVSRYEGADRIPEGSFWSGSKSSAGTGPAGPPASGGSLTTRKPESPHFQNTTPPSCGRPRQRCRHSETGCGWFPTTSALP